MFSSLTFRKGYTTFPRFIAIVLFSLSCVSMVSAEPAEGGGRAEGAPSEVGGSPSVSEETAALSGINVADTSKIGNRPTIVSTGSGEQTIGNGFSPLALYHQADSVGKSVILLLIFSSVLSWTLWLGKAWEVSRYRRRLEKSIKQLSGDSTIDLDPRTLVSPVCEEMLRLAQAELGKGVLHSGQAFTHVQERVHARITRIEAAEARVLTRGAGVLATTSAVAPFVGLFGTVWGIMHSFISIAKSQSTNLSVVAPGIAEALFATALGLLVAIPAVLFFNIITRYIGGYRQLLADASTLIQCLLSHELDIRSCVRSSEELDKVA